MTSSSGMSNIDEDGLWKSWFGNNDDVGSNNGHPLCNRTTSDVTSSRDYGSSNTHTPQSVCDETEDITAAYQHGLSDGDDPENMSNFHGATMIAPSLPMDEKAQIDSPIEEARLHRLHHSSSGDNTDDTTVIAPPLPSSLKMVRGYGFTKPMVRSESSISAFRPSSKNFAPRCPRDGTPEPSSSLEPGIQPISKSRSFPSRVTFASSSPTDESSPLSALSPSRSKPLPRINDNNQGAKERNSVMRSIVGKKTSLGKLFSAKK
ncbi:hypothetical protein BX666DRAFT_1927318 [Dichotomocladium elegans]|nr:hypothetical protein BX666DRAFT_1927318 [Dichotomocladium elegans]